MLVRYDSAVLHPHLPLDLNHALFTAVLPNQLSALLSTVSVEQYHTYCDKNAESGSGMHKFSMQQQSRGPDQCSATSSESGDTGLSDSAESDSEEDSVGAADEEVGFATAAGVAEQEEEFFYSESSSSENNSPSPNSPPYTPFSPGSNSSARNTWKDVESRKVHRNKRFTSRTARANKLLMEDTNTWNLKKRSRDMNNLVSGVDAEICHFLITLLIFRWSASSPRWLSRNCTRRPPPRPPASSTLCTATKW